MAAGSDGGAGAHAATGRPATPTPLGVLATGPGTGHRPANFLANSLEAGPGTILGGKTTLIDPVAQKLWEILETTLTENLENLEVEVRVGRILSTQEVSPASSRRDVGPSERLGLPLTTEAILCRTNGLNFYRFVPGLSEEIFVPLLQRVEAAHRNKDGHFECIVNTEHSVDITYETRGSTSPETFRVSHFYEDSDQSNVVRAFKKKRLGSVDVYAGHRPPEHGPAFDYRVAVSAEEPVLDFIVEDHVAKHKREKHRKKYHFSAWTLEATDVKTTELDVPQDANKNGRQQRKPIPKSSLEIELELKKTALLPNLKAKAEGQKHKLWELLTDFLFAARDLTGLAAEVVPYALPPFMPSAPSKAVTDDPAEIKEGKTKQSQANLALEDADRKAYRNTYGSAPEPVIGHYLYRLAAPRVPVAQPPATSVACDPLASLKRTASAAGIVGSERQVECRKDDACGNSEDGGKDDQGKRLRAKNLQAWAASLKLPGPAPRTAPND